MPTFEQLIEEGVQQAIKRSEVLNLTAYQKLQLIKIFIRGAYSIDRYPTWKVLYKAGLVDNTGLWPEEYGEPRRDYLKGDILTEFGYLCVLEMMSSDYQDWRLFYQLRAFQSYEEQRRAEIARWRKESRHAHE